MHKLIRVSEEFHREVEGRKIIPRETFEGVLRRLLGW